MSELERLGRISRSPESLKVFNDNFNGVSLLSGYAANQKMELGPVSHMALPKIFHEYNKRTEDLDCVAYTSNAAHFLFKDERLLSVLNVNGTLKYLITSNSKGSLARIQNFFYNHTPRSVSHAKKAPLADQGALSFDQIMKKFASRSTLT